MDETLLQWPERLEALEELGSFKLLPTESKKSIYSAVYNNYPKTQPKRFSVRWHETEQAYFVIRKRDRVIKK